MHQVLSDWLLSLSQHHASNIAHHPNYYVRHEQELITTSRPLSFKLGTGEHILHDIFPALTSANFEVLIVTCFYAKSPSQAALASALQDLSSRARNEQRKIRVRISFSSTSFYQTLLGLFSKSHEYPPSSWERLFGITPSKLPGLDLKINSVFIPPFSVMHPKFIIIDRKVAYLPSCNVSWEDWFEGCIELTGDIVHNLLRFWQNFWDREGLVSIGHTFMDSSSGRSTEQPLLEPTPNNLPTPALLSETILDLGEVPTVLLPSPHHVNPKFRPFFASAALSPPTPLNTFILTVFRKATKSIFIQTPNLTSPPVLSSLYEALRRGVDIKIITSSRMMIMEQLLTAGTITEWSISSFQGRYVKLLQQYQKDSQTSVEEGRQKPGQLNIDYYMPKADSSGPSEPVKSHLKLTIVDEEIVILGSGNMDRASWYTSQELCMAFFSNKLAQNIRSKLDISLRGRLRPGEFIMASYSD